MQTKPADPYAGVLAAAREAARACGYALGVHGSQARDLDLIAAPWVEQAVPAEELVKAIADSVGGFIMPYTLDGEEWPRRKPHGRCGWAIQLGGGPYLDVSVMPRGT